MPIIRLLQPGEVPLSFLTTTQVPLPPQPTGSIGTSDHSARADHVHPEQELNIEDVLSITNPLSLGTASPGISSKAAREDHVHPGEDLELSDDLPLTPGTASAGISTEPSRSDHVHGHDDYEQLSNKPNISAFAKTYLDDTDAATTRATIGSVGLSGDETIGGIKTFSEIIIPSSTKGIKGTIVGDNATSGAIGESVTAKTVSPLVAVNGSVQTLVTLTLPAGDWLLAGTVMYTSKTGSTNQLSIAQLFMSTWSYRNLQNSPMNTVPAATPIWAGSISPHRSNSAVEKSVTLTVYAGIISGSFDITGEIWAWRMR